MCFLLDRPAATMASLSCQDVKAALLNWSNIFVVALWICQACLSVSHKRVSIVMKESPFVLTILQPIWIAVAFGIVWAGMCIRGYEEKGVEEDSTTTEEEDEESSSGNSETRSFLKRFFAWMYLLETIRIVVSARVPRTVEEKVTSKSKPHFRVWHSAVMGLLFTTYNFLGYSGYKGSEHNF